MEIKKRKLCNGAVKHFHAASKLASILLSACVRKPQSCARSTTAQTQRWKVQQQTDAKYIANPKVAMYSPFADMPGLLGLREAVRGMVCNCGGAGKPFSGGMAQDRAPSVGRYAEAAELREKLREAKERTDAALGRRSAQAEAVAPRCFRLGQRVTHAVHGYRGVICGCPKT